jgi:hypothetical protein
VSPGVLLRTDLPLFVLGRCRCVVLPSEDLPLLDRTLLQEVEPMRRLALLLAIPLLACGSDPAGPPDPDFAPSVWAWEGPVDVSQDLRIESVGLLIWEHGAATARVEETYNGFWHHPARWGHWDATEETVAFSSDGPDPFPFADGERPTPDEIHTVLSWRDHELPVVLVRVPGAVPE